MKTNLLTTIIGTLLIVVGTFLPWVSALGISLNGWKQSFGFAVFFVIVGIVALGLNFLGKKWSNIVSIVFSVILILAAVLAVTAFNEKFGSAGPGIWMVLIGGVVNSVGSILGLKQKKAE
ncbi:hypothetical protein GCM10009118_26890 [Wandonia haliotis]|uniref:Uncharacterized protein n=1 Tax=Wandonia haliotis TaxID=574963 RepID=A0ABN1MSG4_9FLAO